MRKLLTEFVDLIFPPTAAERRVRTVTDSRLPALHTPGLYKGTIYLCRYQHPVVQALITTNKFSANQRAATLLGALVAQWAQTKPVQSILFVPIPLSAKRQRARGYNQVEKVLCTTDLAYTTRLLHRPIHTAPQTKLDRAKRLSNLDGAFVANPERIAWGAYTTVVLLDDVVTTGATMGAARAKLAPHLPPHITVVCLAVAH